MAFIAWDAARGGENSETACKKPRKRDKRRGTGEAAALCLCVLAAWLAASGWRLFEGEGFGDGGQRLRLAGSTSMARLTGALAEGFMEKYADVTVTVEYTGSSAGVEAVISGTADIGNVTRSLSEQERAEGIAEHMVALDGIGICVDRDNPLEDLTRLQLERIYTGAVNNWSKVGGTDTPIVVIGREAGSGTRSAFEELAGLQGRCAYTNELDSSGAVMAKVAATPGAIGYLSLETADDSVKLLKLESVEPTVENIRQGHYLFSRPWAMVTRGERAEQSRLVRLWFAYVYGEEGRFITEKMGFVPVGQGGLP